MPMWTGAGRTRTSKPAPANGGRSARRGRPPPDLQAAQTDLAAQVHAAVDRLEPDLRDTVQLHYYQDLTLQETADAMGVAASTVKYRLRLALEGLERELKDPPIVAQALPAISKAI